MKIGYIIFWIDNFSFWSKLHDISTPLITHTHSLIDHISWITKWNCWGHMDDPVSNQFSLVKHVKSRNIVQFDFNKKCLSSRTWSAIQTEFTCPGSFGMAKCSGSNSTRCIGYEFMCDGEVNCPKNEIFRQSYQILVAFMLGDCLLWLYFVLVYSEWWKSFKGCPILWPLPFWPLTNSKVDQFKFIGWLIGYLRFTTFCPPKFTFPRSNRSHFLDIIWIW